MSAQYSSEAAIAFAMHCDMNNLSYEEGLELASEIADELVAAAEERSFIPGVRRTPRAKQ